MQYEGVIKKLVTKDTNPVSYQLPIGGHLIPLNELLEKTIEIEFKEKIQCLGCGQSTRKSFNQGYCYKCFISLAKCDRCLTMPELCHYSKGTCREPKWGEENCLIDHTVYLANSSGLKVGITRSYQQTTRWMDQGAVQAMPIGRVNNRLEAGKVEVILKKYLSDKTNWRKMLSGDPKLIDMNTEKSRILQQWPKEIKGKITESSSPYLFKYPVLHYPAKVVSHNLEKTPILKDTLLGIKGQYLIFENSVINIRKYGGYVFNLSVRK